MQRVAHKRPSQGLYAPLYRGLRPRPAARYQAAGWERQRWRDGRQSLPPSRRRRAQQPYGSGTTWLRHPFDDRCQALTPTYAERGNTKRLVMGLQIVDQRGDDARTAATQGMTKGNRAAMRVEFLFIDPHSLDYGEGLGGKCFVKFDDIDIAQLHTGTLQDFLHRRHRANAHDIGPHSRHRSEEHTSELQSH